MVPAIVSALFSRASPSFFGDSLWWLIFSLFVTHSTNQCNPWLLNKRPGFNPWSSVWIFVNLFYWIRLIRRELWRNSNVFSVLKLSPRLVRTRKMINFTKSVLLFLELSEPHMWDRFSRCVQVSSKYNQRKTSRLIQFCFWFDLSLIYEMFAMMHSTKGPFTTAIYYGIGNANFSMGWIGILPACRLHPIVLFGGEGSHSTEVVLPGG